MADPRRRISEGLRGLNAPPPPRRAPATLPMPTGRAAVETGEENRQRPRLEDTSAAGTSTDRKSTRAKTTTKRPQRGQDQSTRDADGLPGRAVGNKRAMVAHLPAHVRDALDQEVTRERATKGVVIMRALREGHDQLAQRAGSRAAPATGPFPAERRVRRRLAVAHRIPTTYTIWPDECEALQQVADTFDRNLSELVTAALALRYKLDLHANM